MERIAIIERIAVWVRLFGGWVNVVMGICFMILFVLLEGNAVEIENLEIFGIGVALVSLGFGMIDKKGSEDGEGRTT